MAKRQTQHKAGAMTHQEAGKLGGLAPHTHGMTRQEAGHKGGVAPHRCRGNECHEKKSKTE